LKKYNPVVIEAGMGPEKMTEAINEFKNNDKHKIIIASINIMNTSVTLTQCKWNLYVERTFNYTIYSQSRGRIFRPGQTEVCRTYMMCFNNSIDNLQLQNLKQKGLVLESLLNKNIVDQRMWRMIFNATGKEKWD
jgi:SNF2 family DNA or RNA helicase